MFLMMKEVGISPFEKEKKQTNKNPEPVGRQVCLMEMRRDESACQQGLVWQEINLQLCLGLCLHFQHTGWEVHRGDTPGWMTSLGWGREDTHLHAAATSALNKALCTKSTSAAQGGHGRSEDAFSGFVSFDAVWSVPPSSMTRLLGPWTSSWAAIIKDHKLDGFKQQKRILSPSGWQKSNTKLWVVPCSLWGLQGRTCPETPS